MVKKAIPYGQTFKLNQPILSVECWNFTRGELFDLPVGTSISLECVNDAKHTTVCVRDSNGRANGLPLMFKNGTTQTGYRFIVENQCLGRAIGLEMPKRTMDLVGDLIRYEEGKSNEKQTKRLFNTLRKTGIGNRLQGHYSSRMA